MTHTEQRERRKEIARLYEAGFSEEELSKAYNLCHQTIIMDLKSAGVFIGFRTAKTRLGIVAAMDGATISEISEAIGCSKQHARLLSKKMGINTLDERTYLSGRKPDPAVERFWKTVDWSEIDSQISKRIGMSRERVRQVRKARGLPPSDGQFRKLNRNIKP